MRVLLVIALLISATAAYADDHSGVGGAIAQIPSDSGGPVR